MLTIEIRWPAAAAEEMPFELTELMEVDPISREPADVPGRRGWVSMRFPCRPDQRKVTEEMLFAMYHGEIEVAFG